MLSIILQLTQVTIIIMITIIHVHSIQITREHERFKTHLYSFKSASQITCIYILFYCHNSCAIYPLQSRLLEDNSYVYSASYQKGIRWKLNGLCACPSIQESGSYYSYMGSMYELNELHACEHEDMVYRSPGYMSNNAQFSIAQIIRIVRLQRHATLSSQTVATHSEIRRQTYVG